MRPALLAIVMAIGLATVSQAQDCIPIQSSSFSGISWRTVPEIDPLTGLVRFRLQPQFTFPTFSYPTNSYPTISYPPVIYSRMSYPTISYPTISYPTISYPTISYPPVIMWGF